MSFSKFAKLCDYHHAFLKHFLLPNNLHTPSQWIPIPTPQLQATTNLLLGHILLIYVKIMQIFETLINPDICIWWAPFMLIKGILLANPLLPAAAHLLTSDTPPYCYLANGSHRLPLRQQEQEHESEGEAGQFLISLAPQCSTLLPWLLFSAPGMWAATYFYGSLG